MCVEFRRLIPTASEEMKRAELDLLIAPASTISEDFPSEFLWKDSITCVVWSHNPRVKNKISLEEYMEMGHICVRADGRSSPDHDRWFLNQFGPTRKIEVTVPDFRWAFQMVEGTNRIATVHLRQARAYLKQYNLRLVEPPVEFPIITELIQWHHHQDRDPALIWFRNFIKLMAAEL